MRYDYVSTLSTENSGGGLENFWKTNERGIGIKGWENG